MKKFLFYVACAIFVWGGLWLALLAQVEESSNLQVAYALASAILFCVAILFSGYGNSLKWKKDE